MRIKEIIEKTGNISVELKSYLSGMADIHDRIEDEQERIKSHLETHDDEIVDDSDIDFTYGYMIALSNIKQIISKTMLTKLNENLISST